MNKKIIILVIVILLIFSVSFILFILSNNTTNQSTSNNNSNPQQPSTSTDTTISLNEINNDYIPEDYSQYEIGGVAPSNIKDRLNVLDSSSNINYFYSSKNKIAFKYEQNSVANISNLDIRESNTSIYLYQLGNDIKSGQSIEVINVDPNLRFNTIPEIITQQILIADEKQGCRVEEINGRYTIKPKKNNQTCGNYVGIDNRFFIKPTEEGIGTNKLIFVNAGSQELSYDGSGKGKYWYESVIVE